MLYWGAPRGLEQSAQVCGRAGRDGRQSDKAFAIFTL
jgi:superfamily II DNA helicase RecQ